MRRYWLLGVLCVGLAGQQLTREYIRLGGRVIAIDSRPVVPFDVGETTKEAGCGDTGVQVVSVTAGPNLMWNVTESSASLALVNWSGPKTGSADFQFNWTSVNCGTSTTQRSATITVSAPGIVKTVTAIQKGGPGVDFNVTPLSFPSESHCLVTGKQLATTAAAGTVTARVAGAGAPWVENLTVSGTTTASVTFNLAKNTSNASRSATIDISNGSYRKSVAVTQNAQPTFTVTTAQPAVFGPSGGSGTLVINSAQTPTVSNVPSWIGISGTTLTVQAMSGNLPPRTATLRFQVDSGCNTGDLLAADLVVTQTNPNFVPGNTLTLSKNFESVPVTGGTYSFQITNLNIGSYYLLDYITPAPGMLTFLSPISSQNNSGSQQVTIQYRISSNEVQPQGSATDSRTVRFSVIQTRDGTRNGYISHADFEVFQPGQQKIQIEPVLSPKQVTGIVQPGCTGSMAGCYTYRSSVNATGKTESGVTVTGPLNATWYPDFYLGPYFMSMDGTTSIQDRSSHSTGTGFKIPNEFRPGLILANNSPLPRIGRLAIFYVGQAGVGGGTLDFITYVQAGTNPTAPADLVPYFPGNLVTPTANGNAFGVFKVEAADNEGATNITKVELRFSTGGAAPLCHAVAEKPTASTPWQYKLYSDAGALLTVGTSPVGNSQCVLKPGGAPAANGNYLTVPFDLEFKSTFRGQRTVRMTATDASALTRSQDLFVDIEGTAPSVVSMSPATGSGTQQVFNFQFFEVFGEQNIAQAELLFGEIGGVHCRARYQHTTRTMSLYDNGLPGAGQAIGNGMSLSNSVCSIRSAEMTPTSGGLSLGVNVAFTSALNGARLVWARVQNNQDLWSVADTGWTNTGVWTVSGSGGAAAGGSSVVLDGSQRLVASLTGAQYSRSEWRMEMRVHNVNLLDSARLLSANGKAEINVQGTTTKLLNLSAGGSMCRYNVTGKSDLLLRVQRRPTATPQQYEFGAWEVSGGTLTNLAADYCQAGAAPTAPDDFQGPSFVIGGAGWNGTNNLTGAIAHFRMYQTAVAPGTAPSLGAESTAAVLRYEFEPPNSLAEANSGPTLSIQPTGASVGAMATPGGGTPPPSSGTSIKLNGNQRLLANVSSTTLSSLNEWRIEMRIHGFDLLDSRQLLSANGQAGSVINWSNPSDPNGTSRLLWLSAGSNSCRFDLTGKSDVVLRWQRRPGAPPDFEVWAPSGGTLLAVPPNYCPAGTVPSAPNNFTGENFVVGGAPWGGSYNLTGAIAYMRMYATAAMVGSAPNLNVESGTTSLLRYEFEGSNLLAEASGGPALVLDTGTLISDPTPSTGSSGGSSGTGPTLTAVDIASTGGSTVPNAGTYTTKTTSSYAFFASDSMHYAYKVLTGDGEMEAQVTSMLGGGPTAKAGVMIRDTGSGNLAPGAKEVFVALQAGKCVAQWRGTANGQSQYVPPNLPATVPVRVKLVRQGDGFSMYCKNATATDWTALLPGPLSVPMSDQVLVGLGASAENATAGGSELTAVFNDVRIASTTPGSGPALTAVEVGSTVGGKTIADNGFYTLYTKGRYAFMAADSIHYAYQAVTGSDWEVEALVTAMNGGALTAKAGLMIREGTPGNIAAGGKEVFVAVQASKCLAQWVSFR